jgi:hypothetical protein
MDSTRARPPSLQLVRAAPKCARRQTRIVADIDGMGFGSTFQSLAWGFVRSIASAIESLVEPSTLSFSIETTRRHMDFPISLK